MISVMLQAVLLVLSKLGRKMDEERSFFVRSTMRSSRFFQP